MIFPAMENRIAEIRKARGLTLQQVAERTDTTNQQISHLERGRRKLTYTWMEKLAAALACHPLELLANPPEASDGCLQPLSSQEQRLLDLFRSLDKGRQEALLAALAPMVAFLSGSAKEEGPL